MRRGLPRLTQALVVLGSCILGMIAMGYDCGPGLLHPFNLERYRHDIRQWSSDGSMIVFAFGKAVYRVSPEGTDLKVVSRGKGTYGASHSPALSPDGSRVAFAHVRSPLFWWQTPSDWEIKTKGLNGIFNRTRALAKDNADDLSPAWSPDGSRIAFISDRDSSGRFQPYIMDANGSNLRRVTRHVSHIPTAPNWSPDGNHIIFGGGIYTFRTNEFNSILIEEKKKLLLISSVAWSPDSRQVAYAASDGTNIAIFTSSLDGSNQIEVMEIGEAGPYPDTPQFMAWSPDGSKLIYSGFGVMVINLDGLAAGRPRHSQMAYSGRGAWSPDGSRVVIARYLPRFDPVDNVIVFTARPDGTDRRPLVRLTQSGLVSEAECDECEKPAKVFY